MTTLKSTWVRVLVLLPLGLALFVGGADDARAEFPGYLLLEGQSTGTIKGEVGPGPYEGWILVETLHFAAERVFDERKNLPTGAVLSRPLVVRTPFGSASPALLQSLANGQKFKTFRLVLVAIDGRGKMAEHTIIELKEAVIVGLEIVRQEIRSPEKALRLHEVAFAYDKLTWQHPPTGATGELVYRENAGAR